MTEQPAASQTRAKTTVLRALGFCGVDDSVSPRFLGAVSHLYPKVEFGVLFRHDKEGQPRYASPEWVQKLSSVAAKSNGKMKLAAHLCGSRVNEVLDGNDSFLSTLPTLGFQRVQINATAVNGVDVSRLGDMVDSFLSVVARHPELEFILQKNDETSPLWQKILSTDNDDLAGKSGYIPSNMSMLVDESKGTGISPSSWPSPPDEYNIGYAGGIGPKNIDQVLAEIGEVAKGREVWIDMESSLRSIKDSKDVFDLDKCYSVIESACDAGFMVHPSCVA